MFMHAREKQSHASFAAQILQRTTTKETALFRPFFPQRNPLALHVIEASKEYILVAYILIYKHAFH
jgi:hypothetical protein